MEQNNFNNFNKNEKNNQKQNREVARNNSSKYDIFDPFFDGFFRFPSFKNEFKELDKIMKTDVKEEENGYVLEVEMPGIKKENINLELNNGYLTIEAKQSSVDEEKSKTSYIRRERYFGSSARSFYVGDIKEEDISASLDSGILKIFVPKEKREELKKRIEIK